MPAKSLKPTGQANLRLARISVALVGLMLVLPFLHYIHENPITTFYQEWWCALLGLLALALLAAREFWQQAEIPRIAQLPAALIVIILLQVSLGKVAYFDQASLYILYLLFASLLMLLGARLRTCFGIEKLSIALAFFLLIGAELSAMIGALQHYRWHTLLDAVIVMQVSSGLYGNLAQPNHFADYIALGLISLGLLYQQRKLIPVHVVLLSVPLLFAMTLSGSRSSWLYLLLMVFLAWWSGRRDAALRPLLRYSVLLVAGFGLMHLIVQLPFMAGADSNTTTLQRLLAYNGGGDTGGSIRLYLWHEAWLMFKQFPILGVGFGQFAWHHFELLPLLRASNISGLYNNAHNLVFQLAAEAGMAGLLALFVALGIWFYGLRRVLPSASHWWGYAALGVLGIHSLLEYPLWYTYFLAVVSILLGAFDETRYQLKTHKLGRLSLAMILLLGIVVADADAQQLPEIERYAGDNPGIRECGCAHTGRFARGAARWIIAVAICRSFYFCLHRCECRSHQAETCLGFQRHSLYSSSCIGLPSGVFVGAGRPAGSVQAASGGGHLVISRQQRRTPAVAEIGG